jgi:hypothetical protein
LAATKTTSQKGKCWLVTSQALYLKIHPSTLDVLDELLCYGWIDGIRRELDVPTYATDFAKENRTLANNFIKSAERLIKEGKIKHAGFSINWKFQTKGL